LLKGNTLILTHLPTHTFAIALHVIIYIVTNIYNTRTYP